MDQKPDLLIWVLINISVQIEILGVIFGLYSKF